MDGKRTLAFVAAPLTPLPLAEDAAGADPWLACYLVVPLVVLAIAFYFRRRLWMATKNPEKTHWASTFWGMGLGIWVASSLSGRLPSWGLFALSIACFLTAGGLRWNAKRMTAV